MGKNMCRLYDEQLVRNIMVATGLSILEYVKSRRNASPNDICTFIESRAGTIIDDTINDINAVDEIDQDQGYAEDDSWDESET